MTIIWIVSNNHEKLAQISERVASKLKFSYLKVQPYTSDVENWSEAHNVLNANQNVICETIEIFCSKKMSLVVGYPLSELTYQHLKQQNSLDNVLFYNLDENQKDFFEDLDSTLNFAKLAPSGINNEEIISWIITDIQGDK